MMMRIAARNSYKQRLTDEREAKKRILDEGAEASVDIGKEI